MTRTRVEFEPSPVLSPNRDIRSGGTGASRKSITREQRDEAIDHALEWMLEHKVWIVEVLVAWTRTAPTVLTVRGHAEHLNVPGKAERIIPDWDEVTEATVDGTPIVRSPAEWQALNERELAEALEDGLA